MFVARSIYNVWVFVLGYVDSLKHSYNDVYCSDMSWFARNMFPKCNKLYNCYFSFEPIQQSSSQTSIRLINYVGITTNSTLWTNILTRWILYLDQLWQCRV